MARGLRLLVAVLVAATIGSGCDGEDVEVDILDTPTPEAILTATPVGSTPVRTATAAGTATPLVTATIAAPTATSGAPTATPVGATPTAGGPTATAPTGTPTPGGPTATAPTPTPTGPTATAPTATPTAGAVDAEVQSAVGDLRPFFTVAGLTTGVSSTSAGVQISRGIGVATQAAVTVDNCPDGGTRTQDDQGTTVTVTLAACKFNDPDLGNFQFDGTITASLLQSAASFNVTALDVTNSRTVTFSGSVSGTPVSGGGFVVNGGPITIATPQGNFTLTLDDLTVDGNGTVVSGGGTLNDDNDLFDLLKIDLTIRTGGLLADLVATFDDNSTASYVLDLKNGSITPAA